MNDSINKFPFFKNVALYLFICAFFSAALQGAAISIFAMLKILPMAPQKYYEDVVGFGAFYFLSVSKHLFLAAAAVPTVLVFWEMTRNKASYEKTVVWRQLAAVLVIFLLVFLPMSFVSFYSNNGLLLSLVGVKAFFPVLALLVGLRLCEHDFNLFIKFFDWLLALNLLIAILQQFYGFFNCGAYTFGCEGIFRSTGLFIEPNTLGALAVCRVLLMGFERPGKNPYSILAAGALLVLSGARAMTIVFVFALILQLPLRSWILRTSGMLLIPILGYLFFLRGFDSLSERLSLFEGLSIESLWFGNGFGYGTQAHHLFSNAGSEISVPPPADSQILALIHQGGLWLLACLVGLSVWFFIRANKKLSGLLLLIFWMSGAAIVTIEVWPLNILIFALIGHALRRHIDREEPSNEEFS